MGLWDELDESYRVYFQEIAGMLRDAGTDRVSMYAAGDRLGLDRDRAKRAGEELISNGFLEIRTLSGDVGLTEEGAAVAERLAGGSADTASQRLGTAEILTVEDRGLVETLTARLKLETGVRSWHFDALNDLMADVKTIEAQMLSSRPKTAIVRECLHSIADILASSQANDLVADVKRAIGD